MVYASLVGMPHVSCESSVLLLALSFMVTSATHTARMAYDACFAWITFCDVLTYLAWAAGCLSQSMESRRG